MTHDEKKNVIIGGALCLGAVVVLFLWSRMGGNLTAPPASTETLPDMTNTGVAPPNYTNYNVPAYNPPGAVGSNIPAYVAPGSGACGCGPDCGVQSNMNTNSVANFLSLMSTP